jgi:hypothetical protein
MRTITVAATIALLTMPAYAQLSPMGQNRGSGQPQQTAEEKAAAQQKILDEKAYKDSLARIPSREKKADPWGGVR